MAKSFTSLKSRSLGSYVSIKKNFFKDLRTFVTNIKTPEDEERLLEEAESGYESPGNANYIVINEGPKFETDGASSGPNQYPLGLSPVKIQYLKDKPAAVSKLRQNLMVMNFSCKFDLEAAKVEIRRFGKNKVDDALHIIQESMVEMDFPAEMMAMMDDMVDYLPPKAPGDVEALVVKVGSIVKVVGMAGDMAMIGDTIRGSKEKLNASLQNKEEIIPMSESCFTYICQYKWKEIAALVERRGLTISTQGRCNIKLLGPAAAVDEVVTVVWETVNGVKLFDVKVGPGINVADIHKVAEEIGKTYQCSITFQQNYGGQGNRAASVHIPIEPSLSLSVYRLKEARVRVVINSIEEQQAHVIVNTTNTKLDLKQGQGVSCCILQAAGPSIQTELRQKYRDGIKHGEVAISGPGKIGTCKAIFHGALPQFPEDNQKSDFHKQADECFKWMVSLIFNCLIKAASNGHLTIAIPAIGTGVLDYPIQHVVQLIYKAIKLFKKEPISSKLKEILIVIHPDTKLGVKQMFLAHRQTHKLTTRHVASLNQMREENKKEETDEIKNCEIRVVVGNSLLQVVNGKIHDACDVSEAILVLWTDEEINQPERNLGLMCTDPEKPNWNCSAYISELSESKCTVDSKNLQRRILLHCYCPEYNEKSLTDALVEGFRKAAKEKYNTVTIPIATGGYMGKKPISSAKIICNAVLKSKTNIYTITVAIEDGPTFETFAGKVAETFSKLHPPANVDKSTVADEVWKKTHADMASKSNAALQAMMMLTNEDSVVLIASESQDNNKKAAAELTLKLGLKSSVVIGETSK